MANSMTTELAVTHLIPDALRKSVGPHVIVLDKDRIAEVAPRAAGPVHARLAMPPLVNAHDHCRVVRSTSFGASGKPLEIWLHMLALVPALDAYEATAATLARSALGGAGTVMVHHTRPHGLTDLPTEAAEMARAARDVGVRVGFAVALSDRNPVAYDNSDAVLAALPEFARERLAPRFARTPQPPDVQIALVDAVASAADSPMFNVQYGPTAVPWCSPALLLAVAEASARTGRRVHMHCLETRYQRDWADAHYAKGMIRYLDEIGLLSPRLTLAHCTHARADELDLLAERGVTIAVNTSSNLALRSGIAPLAEMLRRGCRVALGLDGLAFDEDDDGLRDMRLALHLHAGTGFDTAVDRTQILSAAIETGHLSVTGSDHRGVLAAGQPADVLLLDWTALNEDRLVDDLDPLDLLFARAQARHIAELYVAGQLIVRDGQVLGVDLPGLQTELLARVRTHLDHNRPTRAALTALETALAHHYKARPCC